MPFFISTKVYKQMPFPEIGRWHIVCRWMPNFRMKHGYELVVGVFKKTGNPPDGEMLTSKYYKGFLIARDFELTLAIVGGWNLPTWKEIKYSIIPWVSSYTGNCRYCGFESSYWKTLCIACCKKKHPIKYFFHYYFINPFVK